MGIRNVMLTGERMQVHLLVYEEIVASMHK
jgi:hypothetical protein